VDSQSSLSKGWIPLKYTIEATMLRMEASSFSTEGWGSDSYLAYVSPKLVEQISNRLLSFLSRISFNSMEQTSKTSSIVCPIFRDLVHLYGEAANNGEAIFISIP